MTDDDRRRTWREASSRYRARHPERVEEYRTNPLVRCRAKELRATRYRAQKLAAIEVSGGFCNARLGFFPTPDAGFLIGYQVELADEIFRKEQAEFERYCRELERGQT